MPTGTSGGWNKPKQPQGGSGASPLGSKPKHPLLKGALAGAAVVLVALGAVYFFMLGNEPKVEVKKTTKPHRIKEVTPAPARTNKVEVVAERPRKTQEELNAEFIKRCEEKYGTNMPAGLKTHIYYLKNPPKHVYTARKEYPFLKNEAERSIASVLYTEPGTFFLEPPTFGADFDQDFANAVASPIKIEPDDPEDVKQVKQFVTDMKKQIVDILKTEGKKPSELMTEQGQLMYDLGRFEERLAEALRAAEDNPEMSDADVEDLFKAANILRQKKGLGERPVPDLTTRTLDLKRKLRSEARRARKAALEAAAELEALKEGNDK